ncbi:hypothetical protein NEOLEDRAFT_1077168 [Neolentinus lepideus HHB14362 ss-1]|uniref:Uncharacterized protein n=1 Tax=Neolentinus lepideus HHB14362 ss-1 TaxID=1314782 RepID=A0A165NL56_9AGAM|nr:hypothetical protein NEOLEDRAFT_1077168 [Neolentinus lepideus HHB14362 ss-1]
MQNNEDFVLGAPKHWTDDEKTKFFAWLMGVGQDDHWNSLRASKNACFRECAEQLFGGKKTMQALKGAYERGFNVFKQIYAFELFSRRMGPITINMNSQADRLKEYEKRLQAARKAGTEVGNINARIVDHWHTIGWYDLFYRRWHGDPISTRPIQRQSTGGPSSAATMGDDDAEVEEQLNSHDFSSGMAHPNADPTQVDRGFSSDPSSSIPVQQSMPFSSNSQYLVPQMAPPINAAPSSSRSTIPELTQLTALTQTVMTTYVHLLQTQAEDAKLKLEYLKRKETRDEEESRQRREAEQRRQERETAEWEHSRHAEKIKQRTALATELLSNPGVDASVKQAAGDYLKRLFMTDQ